MRKKTINKKTLIIVIFLIFILGIFLVLELTGKTQIFLKKSRPETIDTVSKTTSEAPSAQDNFSDGTPRDFTPGQKDEGTISDTTGTATNTTPSSQWTTSPSGEITLHEPIANSVLKTGNGVSGTSTLPRVSFRLHDDISGVIAQGELVVVEGKFSGTFSFSTSGQQGRFDIFGTRTDGTEFGNIEVPVRFR